MRDDGGPAFPYLMEHCQVYHETEMHPGITVRQFYKGMALIGIKAYNGKGGNCKEITEDAATIADAMIAEDREVHDDSK